MDKGRVGEDRGSKGMDGCPLTSPLLPLFKALARIFAHVGTTAGVP
jgi:hypothetical protein